MAVVVCIKDVPILEAPPLACEDLLGILPHATYTISAREGGILAQTPGATGYATGSGGK